MSKRKIAAIISAVVVGFAAVCALIIVLFSPQQSGGISGARSTAGAQGQVEAQTLAETLKEKHGQDEKYVYNEALVNVPRNQMFTYVLEFDYFGPENELKANEIVGVYLDDNLTIPAQASIRCDHLTGDITIAPPYTPNLLTWDVWRDPDDKDWQEYEYKYQDWGYAPRYYIVAYVSPTGDVYERPVVTMFTVQNDLSAPKVEYFFKDGRLGLVWEPVPGADEYIICIARSASSYGGLFPSYDVDKLASTTDTGIVYQDPAEDEESMNRSLYTWPFLSSYSGETYFLFVQARIGDSYSNISNPIHDTDIISFLPYSFAYLSGDEYDDYDDVIHTWTDTINELSFFQAVEMLDGSTVLMPVAYDVEDTYLRTSDFYVREEGEEDYTYAGSFDLLQIPYQVVGTSLVGVVNIESYDRATMHSELELLKERESQVSPNPGRKSPGFDYDMDSEPAQSPQAISDDGFEVFATSALVEYLAINMLSGVKEIDITGFNERFNRDALWAAVNEAFYQNPYILGISRYSVNLTKTTLFVEYEETRSEQQRKQAELQNEVARVVDEIISPGMTSLEKQIAINDYLCRIAEYCKATLANAEENNFLHVDPIFNDSFTAYGILINELGVCQGYAMAFKMLADEAGLESIVVTGYMYGTLPHAWNRVLIDGFWMTMDTTNNDSDDIPNNLFNIPDHISAKLLVEDDKYISVDAATVYRGQSEDFEYYRMAGKYYPLPDIADALITDLRRDGYALLRTDFDLDDQQFIMIVVDVLNYGGWDISDIDGFSWLGTIYLYLT